jgi:hypothetical protein
MEEILNKGFFVLITTLPTAMLSLYLWHPHASVDVNSTKT